MLTSGAKQARIKRFIQVAEQTFMVPDLGGLPIFRDDVGSDGNGLATPSNFTQFVPDGAGIASSRALTGKEGLFTRQWKPTYRMMEYIMRNYVGLPVTDTIDATVGPNYPNGRRILTWIDPEAGTPEIEPITGYYGVGNSANRVTGGKLQAFTIDVPRNDTGGDLTGSITYHFNRVEYNVAIPGFYASSETKRINAVNATGNGVFTFPATKNGAGGNITITPAMTAAALAAAIGALAGYGAANVSVSGSTTALNGGIADPTTALGLTTVPAGAIPVGSYQVGYAFVNANGQTKLSPISIFTSDGTQSLAGGMGPAPTGTTAIRFYMSDAPGGSILRLAFTLNAPSTASANSFAWNALPGGAAALAPTTNTTGFYSNGYYDIVFTGTLANYDVPDLVKVSGTGWNDQVVVAGTPGNTIYRVPGPAMQATHAYTFLARSDAQYNAIDVYNRTNQYGQTTNPYLAKSVYAHSTTVSDLWNVFYSQQGLPYATDFVGGARTVGGTMFLPEDWRDGSDYRFLQESEGGDPNVGCSALSFWVKRLFTCLAYEFHIDMLATRSAEVGSEADNDIAAGSFGYGRILNVGSALGSLRYKLVYPL
jgi:hypothetical protein